MYSEARRSARSGIIEIVLGTILVGMGAGRFALASATSNTEEVQAIGAGIGFVLGALLWALLTYGVVRLIRGKRGGRNMLRFVLSTAVILGCIGLLVQVFKGSSKPAVSDIADNRLPTSSDRVGRGFPLDAGNKLSGLRGQSENGWAFPPLINGQWQDSTSGDKKPYREILDSVVDQAPENWRTEAQAISEIRMTKLSFLSDGYLGEGLLEYRDKPALYTFVIVKGLGVIPLTGSGDSIRRIVADGRLSLDTREKAEAYLRFFSAAVSASNGTFRIVPSAENLDWMPSASLADKQKAVEFVRPLIMTESEGGGWKANATVQYGSDIYSAVYHVRADDIGTVEMTDDFPLVQGLPLRHMAFDGPLRLQVGGMR